MVDIDPAEIAKLGDMPSIGFPISFNGERPQPASAPPTLGQHSREVLADAGYDAGEIESLLGDGVVA